MINHNQIQNLIDSNESYSKKYFIWQMNSNNISIEQFYLVCIQPDLDERIIALMQETNEFHSDCESALADGKWRVLTDSEATEAATEFAVERLEDTLRYEMPSHLIQYFDKESFIEDYCDDRSGVLAPYDGLELTQVIKGTTYYIYKQ